MNRDDVIQTALRTADGLASDRLRREDARLYSQHSRLHNRQSGLPSWTEAETGQRLSDAVVLLSAGAMLKEEGNARWRQCFRRSGELLEWLSHPDLSLGEIPVALLSAAAYVVAGFPARANALLRDADDGRHSEILRAFFRGNLVETLEAIRQYWEHGIIHSAAQSPPDESNYFANRFVEEVIRSLGVVCSRARWADESRISVAIQKLNTLANVYASDRDSFSWLLARLTCSVAQEFIAHAWRTVLGEVEASVPEEGKSAIDRYCRLAYIQNRPRAWPSQEEGIARLLRDGSFALCTPTGSGKTSVAEIALISAMFSAADSAAPFQAAPLAMYLVPSRALAAEVEAKLTAVFHRLTSQRIIVTGLYGGTDWGPTDAWLTSEDRTILICTYEKAEALIRFVGPLMLGRLSLVIFDEAHTVQYNGKVAELRQSESRPLRLESLGLRLSQLIDRRRCRMIALSAVAEGIEESIQRWVTGTTSGSPVRVSYRSTRQLIGRLIASPTGTFEIRYDVLDGHRLAFREDVDATPYVRNPIPPRPALPAWTGPEKGLRPALFWAALNFSAPDERGRRHAVLISITMKIADYAKDLLDLIETHWTDELPDAIAVPEGSNSDQLRRAQSVAKDYFGTTSYEYRLLQYGIAVHHSSMPKPLTRLIIDLVQARVLSIVLATSTLSDGVNIPVETIIVPLLYRGGTATRMSSFEFRNLAGRAGRPGVATEGRTLVLMRPLVPMQYDRAIDGYDDLITEVTQSSAQSPRSPLAAAMEDLRTQWAEMTGVTELEPFLRWLEVTTLQSLSVSQAEAFGSIDAIDNVLLSALVESEEMSGSTAWEEKLKSLWNASFGAHTASNEVKLSFLRRGEAIPSLYSNRTDRRRLYRTGLPPSTALELLARMPRIRELFETGRPYGRWAQVRRLQFIVSVVEEIGQIKRFKPPADAEEWQEILAWWLVHDSETFPTPKKIADWHGKVHQWFGYRFCWGLGSVIGTAFEDISDGQLRATTLEDWELTGLPWITFWLKELMAWGTLDPVAAFLMSSGLSLTRVEAEQQAIAYYERFASVDDNEVLDPRAVRDWVAEIFPHQAVQATQPTQRHFGATIVDASIQQTDRTYRVLPITEAESIGWIDVAGYLLARSPRNALNEIAGEWQSMDFVLNVRSRSVTASAYL